MIVTVAFREPYLTHSKRQLDATKKQVTGQMWFHDSLPTKNGAVTENIVAEFQKSLYGFKPHAIQAAINRGNDYVIWLDPSVLPTCHMDVLYYAMKDHPIIVRPGEEPLTRMCNAKAKNWFGVTDEDIKNERTVAGTIYAFNFNHPKAVEVFELWKKAEEEGVFGTQDDFMAGHWADEACMSLAMFKCGVPKYWDDTFTFLNQKNL